MNTRQLRHFIAVMESGSLLAAAKQQKISQPALSKSVMSLEKFYRVPLFDRLPRGVRPTAFALALAPYAHRMLLNIAESQAELMAVASGSIGRVSIGVAPIFAGVVTAALQDLNRSSPDLRITVTTDHSCNLRQALRENRIDLCLDVTNGHLDDDTHSITLLRSDQFVGVCSREHPLSGREIGPAELAQYEWVLPSLDDPARKAIDAYFVSNSQSPTRVKITTKDQQIMCGVLTGTQFLSITAADGTEASYFGGLARFWLKGFGFEQNVGVVRLASAAPNLAVQSIIKCLANRIAFTQPEKTSW